MAPSHHHAPGTAGTTLDESARRLAAIVESSDDAILAKDLDGTVTAWNRAAERLFGYTAAEMIGRSVRLIIPEDRQEEEDAVLEKIRRGEKVQHFETVRQRKDGTLLPVTLSVSPILDDDGQVIGASKIARDITERKDAERARAELLALAQQHAANLEKLNQVGAIVTAALDRRTILQAVADAATSIVGAEAGLFLPNMNSPEAEQADLGHALSGTLHEVIAAFPHPRTTALFSRTFNGEGLVRIDDVRTDASAQGLPVRAYLAVPVKSRAGSVVGGLFLGHSRPGFFTESHEQLVSGVAAWASLALENARLYQGVQEASRLKDEFLATLSHELRTPLNAILGYARMARGGLLTGLKQQKAIETIERKARALTQIVEDILDVSRIVAGRLRLDIAPVDLGQVVQEATETVRPAADARGVAVETTIEPGLPLISGDVDRLRQVAWNLLANAVKFTNRGGSVRARIERRGSQVEFVVSDTGIGIPAAFLPHVFERFRQADAGIGRERGGLGLGLSIVQHLVELHGGTVHAESPGVNQGATFRVSFPIRLGRAGQPGTGPAALGAESASVASAGVTNLAGLRVLVVDDEDDALVLVQEILQMAHAEVLTADSGLSALPMLEAAKPDVLVTDLGMPLMTGFELLERIRRLADPRLRDIPALALTAYARSEDRGKALRAGFDRHLSKPVDPDQLVRVIADLAVERRSRDSGSSTPSSSPAPES